ncbi:MAG: GNAT family protein [Candidatus Dojkabacteria bacterium]
MRSSVTSQTIASIYVPSEKSEEKWIENAYESKTDFVMGVEVDSKLIGIWSAHFDGNNATTGSMITIADYRGKGIGSVAHMFRNWYLFTQLKEPRFKLKSTVHWDEKSGLINPASRRTLEKSGYVQTGILRGEHFKSGRLTDVIQLECYNPWLFNPYDYEGEVQEAILRTVSALKFVEENKVLV